MYEERQIILENWATGAWMLLQFLPDGQPTFIIENVSLVDDRFIDRTNLNIKGVI